MAKKNNYSDFTVAKKHKEFLFAEEFPEGPYGSPNGVDEPVENKSTPWQEGQHYYSAYTYEFRNLHEDLPRQYPDAHPPHDEKDSEE